MQYRQHQLENGLTILAECNDAGYFAGYGFFVRTGSRDETPNIGGVSHFLEHMVFKATDRRSADQVNLELDELGSSSNARTSEESTIYHAAVLPEFQSRVVELLSDLMRPALRDEDFETEKKVIIEEIMMYQDQPPYGGHEILMANYFGKHALGQSILGTPQTVGGLTAPQMREYFERRYSPGNMALVASGKVDFDQLVRDAEKFCGHWLPFEASRILVQAQPAFSFSTLVKEQSTQQYVMQLSPGPSTNDSDRYAMRILTTILGDDSGSRLFWELLDTGLAESAAIGSYEFLGSGMVMSYFCCAPEQAQDNLERLYRVQSSAASGVTAREMELAKQKIVAHILLASERTEARMFSVGGQWLAEQNFKTPAELAKCYKAVTLKDVQEVADKFVLTRNCTLCVGPKGDLQQVA